MRFLLISDTHDKLGVINRLVEQTQADAVIHAGDFGFYGDDSYERLSERELRLLIVHSGLPKEAALLPFQRALSTVLLALQWRCFRSELVKHTRAWKNEVLALDSRYRLK